MRTIKQFIDETKVGTRDIVLLVGDLNVNGRPTDDNSKERFIKENPEFKEYIEHFDTEYI